MTSPPASPHRVRWTTPLVIVALAAIAILMLHRREWVESYIGAWATVVVIALTVLALLVWFAFFSGLRLRTRMVGASSFVAFGAVLIAAFLLATRPDGTYSGVGVPRRVWRWSKPLDQLGPLQVFGGAPVDLAATDEHDFPEFLGPGRHNAVQQVGLSRDWAAHPPQKLWRQPIGIGWSSFAVVGSWAVTQEQRGGDELVVCYEVATGRPRWQHVHPNTRFTEWQGGDGPRATPTIFGGRVYAMGATGILDCLSGSDGSTIWSHNVLEETHARNTDFGKSCSPLIVEDLVIVTGGRGAPSLLAYQSQTGELAWSGGNETPGYASPILATLAGVHQVLTVNSGSVTGHDLSDGRVLWRYNWPGSLPKTVNPVPIDAERVLIAAGYGLGTTMLKVSSAGGSLSVSELWTSRRLKPKFANVVVRGDYVYGLDDGVLTCLSLSNGTRAWRGDEYGFGEVLLVDDLLVVQAEAGDVALVDATPQSFRELARFPALDGKTWTNPALSGHRLLVRNDHEAACYELP